MTLLLALAIAAFALACLCGGVLAVVVWRERRQALGDLAEQLYVDSRLEQLTLQTLAAMREAARRERRPS